MLYVATNDDAQQKYREFSEMFKNNRFFFDSEHAFIKHYLPSLMKKCETFIDGGVYYRGRIHEKHPFNKNSDLFAPGERASAGRINPKGISYLYMSETIQTVVGEVRPWIGAGITIAACTMKEKLKIVDLVSDENDNSKIHSYKRVISKEFSRPVQPNKSDLEYLPTQYIAEFFKQNGYDGVRYESAVNQGGRNLAVFSPDKVDVQITGSCKVQRTEYSLEMD